MAPRRPVRRSGLELVAEDDAEECVVGRASGNVVEVVRNPQTGSVPTTTRASRGFVRSFAERPGSYRAAAAARCAIALKPLSSASFCNSRSRTLAAAGDVRTSISPSATRASKTSGTIPIRPASDCAC